MVRKMINRKIMSELKKRKHQTTIYKLIDKIRKESGYQCTKEDAAYILAGQLDIDIAKYLLKGELERLKNTPGQIKIIETKSKATSKTFDLKIKGIKTQVPFLERKIIEDCRKMSDIYQLFYLLENFIRFFILSTLKSKYPSEDWWHKMVPLPVQRDVQDRKKKEEKNRWHAKRGAHNIHYTNFGDLRKIILKNWNIFGNCFPDQHWIVSKLSELELSRNIIAHNNPLPKDDIGRIKLYFRDCTRQIKKDSK